MPTTFWECKDGKVCAVKELSVAGEIKWRGWCTIRHSTLHTDNPFALYNNHTSAIPSLSPFTDEEIRCQKVGYYHVLDEIVLLVHGKAGIHTEWSSSLACTGDKCYDKEYQQGDLGTGGAADQPEGLEKASQESATELGWTRGNKSQPVQKPLTVSWRQRFASAVPSTDAAFPHSTVRLRRLTAGSLREMHVCAEVAM